MEIDEIERRTFPISRRGYERAEVDAFLTTITAEYRKAASEYREAIQASKDAVRSAATEAAALSSSHTFENVGAHVASILATASQAAETLTKEAEQEAQTIRQAAEDEAAELRRTAELYYTEAENVRSKVEQESSAMRASIRSEVDAFLAEARDRAARIHKEARDEAIRTERVARANVETVIAEGRREYEHLRALQQQVIDRMSSVGFLIQQARDGMAGHTPAGGARTATEDESTEEAASSSRRTKTRTPE